MTGFTIDELVIPKTLDGPSGVEGRMVARAIFETRADGPADVAWLSIEVLQSHRVMGGINGSSRTG